MEATITTLHGVLKTKLADEIQVPTIWVDYDGTKYEDYTHSSISARVVNPPCKEISDNALVVSGTILQVGSHVTTCGSIASGEVSTQLDLSRLFRGATNLISLADAFSYWDFEHDTHIDEIPSDLFKGCPNLVVLTCAFMGTRGIKALPSELFANNPKLNNLYKCFMSCTSLETIPGDLFKNNHNLGYLVKTFERTSIEEIPLELFSTLNKDTEVDEMFTSTKATSTRKKFNEYNWPPNFLDADKKRVLSNIA